MFRFIKSLEKEVYTAAILVLVIIGLTTEGFGGAGRSAMAAMAETPAAVREEERGVSGKQAGKALNAGKDPYKTVGEGSETSLQAGFRETDNEISQTANTDNIEYGQQVVGYFLEKEIKQRQEEEQKRVAARESEEAAAAGENFLNQQDYQVLLKIVEAEAGVCDDRGKILVANVILNRVKSDEFPNSVTEVVYQPSQFSPVSNGSINTCKVTSETVESVNRALKGEDYSQGALFFMNRSASRSGAVRWFDGRLTYLFRYQGHEFFK